MSAPVVVGPVSIHPGSRIVRVDGRVVERLTRLEYDVLLALADPEDPHRVLSRREIVAAVWGEAAVGLPQRTLDAHCCRLRAKLSAGTGVAFVENCHGIGYRLVPLALAEQVAA